MIIFIYAFAWVFVLSSALPGIILGKNRSVLIQFVVCLVLTFVSFIIHDGLFSLVNGETIQKIMGIVALLENPYLAIMYLSLPYIIISVIDVQTKRSNRWKVTISQPSLINKDLKKV